MDYYLDDDEVVALILSRPHLIPIAFERLQKELEEAHDLSTTALKTIFRMKKRIRELEKDG